MNNILSKSENYVYLEEKKNCMIELKTVYQQQHATSVRISTTHRTELNYLKSIRKAKLQ